VLLRCVPPSRAVQGGVEKLVRRGHAPAYRTRFLFGSRPAQFRSTLNTASAAPHRTAATIATLFARAHIVLAALKAYGQ
jgi:hypothetical protein